MESKLVRLRREGGEWGGAVVAALPMQAPGVDYAEYLSLHTNTTRPSTKHDKIPHHMPREDLRGDSDLPIRGTGPFTHLRFLILPLLRVVTGVLQANGLGDFSDRTELLTDRHLSSHVQEAG